MVTWSHSCACGVQRPNRATGQGETALFGGTELWPRQNFWQSGGNPLKESKGPLRPSFFLWETGQTGKNLCTAFYLALYQKCFVPALLNKGGTPSSHDGVLSPAKGRGPKVGLQTRCSFGKRTTFMPSHCLKNSGFPILAKLKRKARLFKPGPSQRLQIPKLLTGQPASNQNSFHWKISQVNYRTANSLEGGAILGNCLEN